MESRDGGDDEPVVCLGGCGRTLTSDLSKFRKLGPDCWRKLHGRSPRRSRRTATATAKPGPGQPELPYDDQLELWSTT